MKSPMTPPYERRCDCQLSFVREEKAAPATLSFACGAAFCLSLKLRSPAPEAFFISLMPTEYPRAASASRSASLIIFAQNCFVKTIRPIPTTHSFKDRHVRTTKFGFDSATLGKGLAEAKLSPCEKESEKGLLFRSASANSALVDKAYLPGIKPVFIVSGRWKDGMIFHRNYSSLSIDPLSKEKS